MFNLGLLGFEKIQLRAWLGSKGNGILELAFGSEGCGISKLSWALAWKEMAWLSLAQACQKCGFCLGTAVVWAKSNKKIVSFAGLALLKMFGGGLLGLVLPYFEFV